MYPKVSIGGYNVLFVSPIIELKTIIWLYSFQNAQIAITTLLQQHSVVMQSFEEFLQSNSHVETWARGLYKTLVTGTTAFGLLKSLLILRPLGEMNNA